jgi:hypothetical protein
MLDEKMTLAVQLKKSKDEHQKEVNLLKPVWQNMQEENEQVSFIINFIIKCLCIVLNKTLVNVLNKY